MHRIGENWREYARLDGPFCGFDGDGGAALRAASVGPHRVAGARAPGALGGGMAADGLVAGHDGSGGRGGSVGVGGSEGCLRRKA